MSFGIQVNLGIKLDKRFSMRFLLMSLRFLTFTWVNIFFKQVFLDSEEKIIKLWLLLNEHGSLLLELRFLLILVLALFLFLLGLGLGFLLSKRMFSRQKFLSCHSGCILTNFLNILFDQFINYFSILLSVGLFINLTINVCLDLWLVGECCVKL